MHPPLAACLNVRRWRHSIMRCSCGLRRCSASVVHPHLALALFKLNLRNATVSRARGDVGTDGRVRRWVGNVSLENICQVLRRGRVPLTFVLVVVILVQCMPQ